jgi:NAD(P) transhydrogenase subunit alpha
MIPSALAPLLKSGLTFRVEAGAGDAAGFPDSEYRDKGAELTSRDEVFQSDIVLQVQTYGSHPQGKPDLGRLRKGQVLIGMADPLSSPQRVAEMAQTGVTGFGLELIPRITRAQSMDVLSSMATVAGYKAVLLAASKLPRMFPMFMTAAGTLKAAKVFIMGAGVAGLQAIGTAKRLGGVVSAFDVRSAVKEQIESLGAKFVEVPLEAAEGAGGYAAEQSPEYLAKQRALLAKVVAESDVVITTAAIPGKKAPVLVTADMVKQMQPGSVIVDLAAERGGNCELTKSGEEVVAHGVTILGPENLPSSVPYHASQMLSKNIATFLKHLLDKEGKLVIDIADEITSGTLMCQDGQIVHPQLKKILGQA